MIHKLTILTITGHYLPGYKSGGPLRTIVNMVEQLSNEFSFWIITKDRDLGDTESYSGIQADAWQPVGKAMVYYLSPECDSLSTMGRLIAVTHHDVLYLNSFFDPFGTIRPLLARWLGRLPDKPLVLAPRGEFSSGALQLKYLKKYCYIQVARLMALYRNITWQASSEFEAQDIINALGVASTAIHMAMDLPALPPSAHNTSVTPPVVNTDSCLQVVFLSRISPKKNLNYALSILQQLQIPLIFDIYGPKEDNAYWQECQRLIDQLPRNICATYRGSVSAEQVRSVFSQYDLFFFPTRGENYGHVIAESLSVGTPVLISDQTPWRNLEEEKLGWDLSLKERSAFANIIDNYSHMPMVKRQQWRKEIVSTIYNRLSDPVVLEANRELFRKALRTKL